MKKLLSVIMALVLMITLASCGDKKDNNEEEQKPQEIVITEVADLDTTKDINIEFWHAMGKVNQNSIQKIIDNFNFYYPNIHVTQTSFGDYTTLRDTITSGIAADELPTIAQTYPDHVALYINGGAMRELNSYLASEKTVELSDGTLESIGLSQEEQNKYIPGFWAEGSIYDSIGTMYSIPFNKSTEVLYYNKTIFEKYGWTVPKTWEEAVEIGKLFKQTTEYAAITADGSTKAAGLSYDSEANMFITLTQQWGGQYTGFYAKGNGVYLFGDSQASKDAMQFYADKYTEKLLATTTYFGTNYSSDAFKAGQTIMTIGSSAGASYNVPTDGSFEVGVAAYLQHEGSDRNYVIQQGTNVSLFKRTDAQEELAGWLFMKFLTNYDSALIWCTDTSYFPIRKDVLNSDEYKLHISGAIVDESTGSVIYKPTTQNLAQIVGLDQQDWFFTNVAFVGSSKARDNAGLIVQAILYGGKSVANAYKEAIDAILYS